MFRNWVKYFLPMLAVVLCIVLPSCENDLKKIQELSSLDAEKPVQKTTNVELIFSDSALVKARVLAPLLLEHTGDSTYKEMPKGVEIFLYDKQGKVENTVKSKYGKLSGNDDVIELYKNVVATNAQGDVFKSEELIWRRAERKINSSQPVQITMSNGDVINGTSFESNEKLYPYTIKQSTGIFKVNENPDFQ